MQGDAHACIASSQVRPAPQSNVPSKGAHPRASAPTTPGAQRSGPLQKVPSSHSAALAQVFVSLPPPSVGPASVGPASGRAESEPVSEPASSPVSPAPASPGPASRAPASVSPVDQHVPSEWQDHPLGQPCVASQRSWPSGIVAEQPARQRANARSGVVRASIRRLRRARRRDPRGRRTRRAAGSARALRGSRCCLRPSRRAPRRRRRSRRPPPRRARRIRCP